MAMAERVLVAETRIALSNPERALQELCAYFSKHFLVDANGNAARIESSYGIAVLSASDEHVDWQCDVGDPQSSADRHLG